MMSREYYKNATSKTVVVEFKLNSANDASTSCKTFVNVRALTLELTSELICELLARHGKNWCIQPNIPIYTGPVFSKFSGLVDNIWMAIINVTFNFAIP